MVGFSTPDRDYCFPSAYRTDVAMLLWLCTAYGLWRWARYNEKG
jgi:hypothetical protein